MNRFTRTITIGAVVGLAGVGLFGVAPAMAGSNATATTLSMSPTTVRAGEPTVLTINGLTTGSFEFTGCEGSFFNGLETYDYYIGETLAAGPTPTPPNLTANDLVGGYEIWSGVQCGADNTRPVGTADMTTGDITITPQLQVESVTANVGTQLVGASGYTEKSATGSTPFEWTLGGAFAVLPAASCGLAAGSVDAGALPAGVTLDETTSAANTAPVFTLSGTPAVGTEGDYKVCINLHDGYSDSALAWLTVSVLAPQPAAVPALANTGANDAAVPATVGGSLLALALGSLLVVRRQRRRVNA